jgi:putative acetyltransferase
VECVIGVESPLTDEMRALISELNTLLLSLTPAEACHHMSVEDMAGEETTVFAARDVETGTLLACGALRRHPGGIGEVKRMYTRPDAQGHGIGGKILAEIETLARYDGLEKLMLETGIDYLAAARVYRRAGFIRCGPVLDYPDTPHTAFLKNRFSLTRDANSPARRRHDRADETDPDRGARRACRTRTPEKAREMAKASDERIAKGEGGALEGIPLGIKDLFATEGVHTQACSHIPRRFKPAYESTVTSNLWAMAR